MKRNRILATLTALCLVGTLVPASVLAAEGQMPGHLDDCKYICNHIHNEDCGYVEAVEGRDCADVHEHDDACGYAEGQAAVECSNENCNGTEEGHVEHQDAVSASDCGYTHEHDGSCGYAEAVEGVPCDHQCGEDEWVCAEECPVANAGQLTAAQDATITKSIHVWGFDSSKNAYVSGLNQYISLTYIENNEESLKAAALSAEKTCNTLAELQGVNPYYYVSSVNVSGNSVGIYFRIRQVDNITASAVNGTVSYKTAAMDAPAPLTGAIPNDQPITLYFTPAEGYELESVKYYSKDITNKLTANGDGSFSFAIAAEDLYYSVDFKATFIKAAAVVENLTLDVADGPIAVTTMDDNLLVVQGDTRYVLTGGALTLKGDGGQNTVKLGDGVKLALVTDGVTLAASAANPAVSIGADASIEWELKNDNSITAYNANAIRLNAGANVRIYGEGALEAANGMGGTAAIRVPQGAKLVIDEIVLNAKGSGAAIGSDWTSQTTPFPQVEGEKYELTAGSIEIVNGAKVTAVGGTGSAAIGGGQYANGGTTLIGAGCTVYATAGGNGAAAIGGGTQATYKYQQYGGEVRGGGKAGNITIESGATVVATSNSGAAIGRAVTGGQQMIADTSGSITIEAGANVTAISLGHDNSTGEHGKPYYFAIDAGIANNISAPILNARFDKGALPRKQVTDKTDPYNPVSIPQYNNIIVAGNNESIALALPASSPSSAFAVTVSGAGDYMVANAAEGKEIQRAEYLLENGDSQFLFTVGSAMTTRDQLKFASYTITASAGEHGSISDAGETSLSPLGGKTYTFTPDAGYVVDTVTVDGAAVDGAPADYTFADVTADHTITVSFKTAPVVVPDDPDPVTYYTVTVNYLNADGGAKLADSYTVRRSEGSRYDVSAEAAKAISGYAIDRVEGETSGALRGNVTVDVYYAAETTIVDPVTPIGPTPPVTEPETPDVTIDEGDVPTGALPELPVTPAEPENPGETVIVEEEVPLGNLPQTGTVAAEANPALTLGAVALALSLTLAGVTAVLFRKREEEQE